MHVFLSYPKSGRTWVRFMVDAYLCRTAGLDLPNVFAVEKHEPSPRPILWTHLTGAMILDRPYWEMGPWNLGPHANATWLVLLRNFHATLASAYFQARDRIRKFHGTPAEFVRHPNFGVIKLATFLNLFAQTRAGMKRVEVFHYEAIKLDPRGQLQRVLAALDLPIDIAALDAVLAAASFENMRRLSVTPEYAGTVLAPTDASDPSTFKVRRGDGTGRASGRGAHDLFSGADRRYIDDVLDLLLVDPEAEHIRCCRGEPAVAQPRTQASPVAQVKLLTPTVTLRP